MWPLCKRLSTARQFAASNSFWQASRYAIGALNDELKLQLLSPRRLLGHYALAIFTWSPGKYIQLSREAIHTMATITPRFLQSLLHSKPLYRQLPLSKSFLHTRAMSTTISRATPRFAEGTPGDDATLAADLEGLLLPKGQWILTPSGEGLQRLIRFKTFQKAWSFMDAVAIECKKNKHHPEWSNTYNTVFVRWTTHAPKGLSAKDIYLAGLTDDHAQRFGELKAEREEGGSDGARESLIALADEIGKTAPDCCVPKSSRDPKKVQSPTL
jgi:4a-hydroxytetrahydrobiopterin dehydratase